MQQPRYQHVIDHQEQAHHLRDFEPQSKQAWDLIRLEWMVKGYPMV